MDCHFRDLPDFQSSVFFFFFFFFFLLGGGGGPPGIDIYYLHLYIF